MTRTGQIKLVLAWIGSAMFGAFALGAPWAPPSTESTASQQLRSRQHFFPLSLCCSLRRFNALRSSRERRPA
jgi:hypothetical protein